MDGCDVNKYKNVGSIWVGTWKVFRSPDSYLERQAMRIGSESRVKTRCRPCVRAWVLRVRGQATETTNDVNDELWDGRAREKNTRFSRAN